MSTRTIRVECTWRSTHEIEIPADASHVPNGDIEAVLKYEDVTSATAELVDWDVRDPGPDTTS